MSIPARARLLLLVAGESPRSRRARMALQEALAEQGIDRSCLETVDVLAAPETTLEHGVFATPALLLYQGGRLSTLYGDLSDRARLTGFLAALR